MFFYVHGGRFAGGAHHANAIGAFGNVPVDELAQGGVIDAAVFKHGGNQGDDAALQADGGSAHKNFCDSKKKAEGRRKTAILVI